MLIDKGHCCFDSKFKVSRVRARKVKPLALQRKEEDGEQDMGSFAGRKIHAWWGPETRNTVLPKTFHILGLPE